ncbi:MAG: DUF3108 domain-containing protein [Bacteroidaceae bacterium]|nr:DUF3108 domain-containing protein [Bacteroidaceae bacterium]
MTKFKVFLLMLCLPLMASAQCTRQNKAFQAGESLTYDLYFNWKFVWVKAGTAHYKISNSTYAGKPSLRTDLLFQGSKRLNAVFPMKDTLISQMTPELVPLYFRKGATEGKHYTVDEVWYSYPGGKSHVKQKYLNRHGEISNTEHESDECNYDMLSILNVARSFDPSTYIPGHRIHFPMATGTKVEPQTLIYKGKENFEANDDVTYRCLVFSLLDYESKKEKELLRFYITDDLNHLPVRIDFYLRFGVAKAYYVSGKGLKNEQTSVVKKK